MAYRANAKLFESDLSNYAEIRRGLSPAMRQLTPTKKELQSVDAETREKFIKNLNNWRLTSQKQKMTGAAASTGPEKVFERAIKSGDVTGKKKIAIMTAAIRARTKDLTQIKWEIREAFNAVARLHDKDFYKAKGLYDKGNFRPEEATTEMLTSAIDGGLFVEDKQMLKKALKEKYERTYGPIENLTKYERDIVIYEINEEVNAATKARYTDIENVAKILTY